MADLTKIINTNYLVKAIDTEYERRNIPRSYLGLSECGDKCQRVLWYKYNKIKATRKLDGRILRLFQLGNVLEEQMRKDLMDAGYAMCYDQKEISFEYQGLKLTGHIDGIISNLQESNKPHLWECKTCNQTSFNKLLKLNSYEQWNEKYKFQVHAYMLGLELDRCLINVYNKNDSNIYTERIKLDKPWIINKLQVVFKTIGRETLPPTRTCPKLDWYEAKWCSYSKTCWS